MTGLFDCERNPTIDLPIFGEIELPGIFTGGDDVSTPGNQGLTRNISLNAVLVIAMICGTLSLGIVALLVVGIAIVRRPRDKNDG